MKKFIIIIFILGIVNSLKSQQALTLYNMDRVLQSHFVNPAADSPYKIHIGGLMVPILGQIPPSMSFNYANNSLHYNNIFHKGTGNKSDNLVLDLPLTMKKLKKNNHFRFDTQLELINVGIKLENRFIFISLTEKVKFGFSLPYDLFEFTLNGNKPYMEKGKEHDMSHLDVNFTHYRELGLGTSQNITDNLRIGGRIKILFGESNLNSKINNLTLCTDPNNYRMSFITDMTFRSSLPFDIDYQYNGPDSVRFEFEEDFADNIDYVRYFLNFRNMGFGLDLGLSYRINDKWEVFGSITDLGVLFWNSNIQNYTSKGDFDFNGVELKPNDADNQWQGSLDALGDTLINTFIFDAEKNNNYSTWLSSSIYLGGTYKFHEKLDFGALYRGEFYRKSYLQSLTLSANSRLTDWFSAHVSYSFANNSFTNLGLGFSIRAACMNWFFVTDNLTGIIWPQKSRIFNIRMGCNLIFGYKKPVVSPRI